MREITLQSGFIALISVIIISALLLAVTAALSTANYFARFNILEDEFKHHSNALAEACINFARGQVADNQGYVVVTPVSVAVGTDVCRIVSVSAFGGQTTINTQGIYPNGGPDRSYTNLTVVLNSDLTIYTWRETPD
ncbi:MAG: hypothetical protein P4L74_07480 [Candidatus Doudnabacteria bacterium]|nr:hypothetical protein [Candidatus Doudnabacteria bacterium]